MVLLNEDKVFPSSKSNEENTWYLDNGASNHMTGVRDYFAELDENVTGLVLFGDRSKVQIKGKGMMLLDCKNGEQLIIPEVYFILALRSNIISLGQMTEEGYKVEMLHEFLRVHDENMRLIMKVQRSKNRLYKIVLHTCKPVCLHTNLDDTAWLWHARLGHVNFRIIESMVQRNLVHGVPHIHHPTQVCEGCLVSKQTRQTFPKETQWRASCPLELLHANLYGPITPHTLGGNRYFFLIVDDYSRYMWVFIIKSKDEALQSFKRFKVKVENETSFKVKALRTDQGGEFVSNEFKNFCDKEGIRRQLTAPYTPQQNGVVERRNRTILGVTRSLLKTMNVPEELWGEDVRHAVYILNRVPTKGVKDMTLFEAMHGRKPTMEHIRVFGCVAYAKRPANQLTKLSDKSIALVHLGVEPGSKAYQLYNPNQRRICVARDVVFDEKDLSGSSSSQPTWGTSASGAALDIDRSTYDDTPFQGFRSLQDVLSRIQQMEDYQDDELMFAGEEPTTFIEAENHQDWKDAMKRELDSIERNHTWVLTDLPKGQKPIGLKWVFKLKKDASGKFTTHKARIVAKGYVQRKGIDFDEVFAPVARLETVRLMLALAAKEGWTVHHLDVKSVFLNGTLEEEVYVSQSEGFIVAGKEHMVYRLSKALYGLRQAPRAWNAKLDKTLKELGFLRCPQEQAVYKLQRPNSILLVGAYVDDLIVMGTSEEQVAAFKKQMKNVFEMTDMGKPSYYLGIEVHQRKGEVAIAQTGYAKKVLKLAGMADCNPSKYPMESKLSLTKDEGGVEVNSTDYRRLVGSLRYLTHTRPDLAYSVGVVSRFMESPKESHFKAVKQILRYIKGTQSHGLVYRKGGDGKLIGFSDSSYGMDPVDGKGTTGMVFYYSNSPITWSSQKQRTVALSSCKAEFMAATMAAWQALWLRSLLKELTGSKAESIKLCVDNKSAIALMKNSVFHGRSKHIDTRFHFIRECVENKQIIVEHVSGEEQKADILTKALPRVKFSEMQYLLGMEDLEDTTQN
ncbi:hypothetical protein L2E82_12095 [Cichorium intybus]|uniref:Uncharacterized protein n=1 Tax=Cichorium intybus TaxID=13427 RepID=A0ACB9GF04_CICIN|nr:hypothetical protein L2E82_12095 [Cichorium intybus]